MGNGLLDKKSSCRDIGYMITFRNIGFSGEDAGGNIALVGGYECVEGVETRASR